MTEIFEIDHKVIGKEKLNLLDGLYFETNVDTSTPFTGFIIENKSFFTDKKYFVNGEIYNGEFKDYYDNGTLKTLGYFRDGKRTGEWQNFYSNGKINNRVRYLDDQLQGIRLEYSENGTLIGGYNYFFSNLSFYCKY